MIRVQDYMEFCAKTGEHSAAYCDDPTALGMFIAEVLRSGTEKVVVTRVSKEEYNQMLETANKVEQHMKREVKA